MNLRECGIMKKTTTPSKSINTRDKIFIEMLKNHGLPAPTSEYKFHESRKWRFDFAFIKEKIAVEIEGGLWNYGRHNRAASMIKDLEKYNCATSHGWHVFRFIPHDILKTNTIELIKNLFEVKHVR